MVIDIGVRMAEVWVVVAAVGVIFDAFAEAHEAASPALLPCKDASSYQFMACWTSS